MDPESNDITYAKTQLKEASRRLESVQERITEVQTQHILGEIDSETNEFRILESDGVENTEDELLVSETEEEVVNIEGHIQNIIIDCQMSIELSVKAMFKAVGQDFDYSHGIEFDSHNTQGFNSEIPAEYPRGDDIIRAIFLTQLWERFYELAKYGAPELNVGPSVIFDISDGQKALNDATFCVDLADDFIYYMESHRSQS